MSLHMIKRALKIQSPGDRIGAAGGRMSPMTGAKTCPMTGVKTSPTTGNRTSPLLGASKRNTGASSA